MDIHTHPIDFSRPLDLSLLKDRIALVTGGASGIGAGTARALAEAGVWVSIVDTDSQLGEALVKELEGKGHCARFYQTDTRDWQQQVAAFKQTIEWGGGRLDIVIPSAGLSGGSLKAEIESATADEPVEPDLKVLDVNLKGVYYSASLALFHFARLSSTRETGLSPQLCFISSLAGYVGLPWAADYCAAKFGVRGLWKTLRANGGAKNMGNCQVNLVAPTYIRSPMTEGLTARLEASGIIVGEVEDVVAGVMRVVGDETVDGRAICTCDGGKGGFGSNNFDLDDDLEHGDGALKLRVAAGQGGPLGAVMGIARHSES